MTAAEAAVDTVATGMLGGTLRVEQALVHHHLHPRVIARLRGDPAPAEQVETRVTRVRPVGLAILDDAGDHRGARRIGQILVKGVIEDRMMGARQHARQEQHDVRQAGLGFALERLGHELHRDLRCNLAMQMPAHAIGKDHEQSLARVAICDPVLIGTSLSDPAFLKDGEFHWRPMNVRRRLDQSVNQDAGTGSSPKRRARAFCSA